MIASAGMVVSRVGKSRVDVRKMLHRFALCLFAGMLSGCATGRIADLRDCGSLSVGVGPGLGVQARIGAVSHPSLGLMSWGPRVGLENRHLAGAWHETEGYAPLMVGLVYHGGPLEDFGNEFNLSYARICSNYVVSEPDYTFRSGFWINTSAADDPASSAVKRATDLEIGCSAILVSGRVGINPLEMLDFLLGFVGLDIANDDPVREETTPPAP